MNWTNKMRRHDTLDKNNAREREQEIHRENFGKDFAMEMYEQVCA